MQTNHFNAILPDEQGEVTPRDRASSGDLSSNGSWPAEDMQSNLDLTRPSVSPNKSSHRTSQSTRFHQLLTSLAQQHDFEIEALQRQICESHKEADGTGAVLESCLEEVPFEHLADDRFLPGSKEDILCNSIEEPNRVDSEEKPAARHSSQCTNSIASLEGIQFKGSLDCTQSDHSHDLEERRSVLQFSVRPDYHHSQHPGYEKNMQREFESRIRPQFKRHGSRDHFSLISSSGSTWTCKFTIHPASKLAVGLNGITFAVVLYDLMTIPLQAFQISDSWFSKLMGWVTQLYWNIDLVLSFLTGYYSQGQPVLLWHKTVKHYLRTWFSFDAVVVGMDWFFFAMSQHSSQDRNPAGVSRLGKTLRSLKFLRTLRLLKTAKVMVVGEALEDFFSADIVTFFSLFKLIMGVLIMNHLMACIWYFVGNNDDGWVQSFQASDWPFFRKYCTSYYWAVTQVGSGGSGQDPNTGSELVLAIFLVIGGLLVVSSVISSVTNIVAGIQERKSVQIHQFRVFRRFCQDHSVPSSLCRRLKHYLEYHFDSGVNKVQINQVAAFEHLSQPLMEELQQFLYEGSMDHCQFLVILATIEQNMVRKIAGQAIEVIHAGPEDTVYMRGAVAQAAYVLTDGQLSYQRVARKPVSIQVNEWFCEPALWIAQWQHLGHVKADVPADLLVLNVKIFAETLRTHVRSWMFAHKFAIKFCRAINREPDPCDLYSDDNILTRQTSDESDIFSDMDRFSHEMSVRKQGCFSQFLTRCCRRSSGSSPEINHRFSGGKEQYYLPAQEHGSA